jgi:prolipoprotein diacylglyceryl transferase
MPALPAWSYALLAEIPAPGLRQLEIGPLSVRLYALTLLIGIAVGMWITLKRWVAQGGDPDVVYEVTFWAVAAGLIGGRLYHVITSWDQVTKEWWGPFAIWEGGLGIWGGVLFGLLAGAWVAHRRGAGVARLADAAAPGLLVGQGIGRLGNYFNQELFGTPTDLPWALSVDAAERPAQYADAATFHPVFLYEMLWNFGLAALLVWIGYRFAIRPPGLFALYVAGYSLGRVFWEQLRIDPANEFLGQRINFYVALALMVAALAFFVWNQRRTGTVAPARAPAEASGSARPKAKAKSVPGPRRR